MEQLAMLTARRASGYMRLNEEALRKETVTPAAGNIAGQSTAVAPGPIPAPATAPTASAPNLRPRKSAASQQPIIPTTPSNAQLAEIMRQHAETERDRLVQHPALKWTWGVDVEEADLQSMFRGGDRNYLLPHTGYDSSLPGNVEAGEWSETASHPRSADRHYHTHADNPGVPELLSKHIPLHFHKYPLRRHDYGSWPSGNLPSGSVANSQSDAATTPAELEAAADVDGYSSTSSVSVSAALGALESPHQSAQDGDPFLDSVCAADVFEELSKQDSLDEDQSCEAAIEPLPLGTLYPLPSAGPDLDTIAVEDMLHELDALSHQSDAEDSSASEIQVPSSPNVASDAGHVSPTETLLALQNMLLSGQDPLFKQLDADDDSASEHEIHLPEHDSDIGYVSPSETLDALLDVITNEEHTTSPRQLLLPAEHGIASSGNKWTAADFQDVDAPDDYDTDSA
jgi:hypothetical protein